MSTLHRIAILEERLCHAEIEEAVSTVVALEWGHTRQAAQNADLLRAFAATYDPIHSKVAFGGLIRKLTELAKIFKRAPELLNKVKEMLGDLSPANITQWVKEGKNTLLKALKKTLHDWPLGMLFKPKANIKSISDLVYNIIKNTPIGKALSKINAGAHYLDEVLNKYLPKWGSRALKAAVFIFIWFNVLEITWDVDFLLDGFTGALNLADIFASLPESALGRLLFNLGFGWNVIAPALLVRLMWLVANNYIEWIPGKGFKVYWNLMGKFDQGVEMVPV